MLIIRRAYNEHPGNAGQLFVNLPGVPSLRNVISQPLINQQGLDVEFSEHRNTVAAVLILGYRENSVDCLDSNRVDVEPESAWTYCPCQTGVAEMRLFL